MGVLWIELRKLKKDLSNNAFIVVETKAENVKIHIEDYYQGRNYARYAGADFFVTSNQKETKIFTVNHGKIPKIIEEVVAIPTAKDVENEKKIAQIKN